MRSTAVILALVASGCGRIAFDPAESTRLGCVGKLASYGDMICVLRDDGAVWCWGQNAEGELGDGTFVSRATPQPSLVTDAVDLASGEDTTCAILRDGSLVCWGLNDLGQVGDGTMTDRAIPTPVSLPAAAIEVRVGQYHACARLADGTGRCWGSNVNGELGSATPSGNQLVPQGAPIGGVRSLTVGDNVTCVIRADGSADCFGLDSKGELGDGLTTSRFTPMPILVPGPIASVVGGCHRHLCAVTEAGEVWCWGENMTGEVGNGTPSPFEATPIRVPGIADAVQVTVGAFHSCARTAGGEIWCWGANDRGQLGDGTLTNGLAPVRVATTGDVVDVQAHCSGTFVVRGDGTLAAWGSANLLGTGDTVDQLAPVEVPLPCP